MSIDLKNYDDWNQVKKSTNKNKRKLGIKPREIFWAKIGQNIGSEEYGKDKNFARPIIIIRQLKNDSYFHKFKYINKQNGEVENSAMILQFRVFSIKRLMNKAGIVNKSDFQIIIKKCKEIISPT